jgi:hypothetical protein
MLLRDAVMDELGDIVRHFLTGDLGGESLLTSSGSGRITGHGGRRRAWAGRRPALARASAPVRTQVVLLYRTA